MYYLKKQPGYKIRNVIFLAIFCLIAGVSIASAASPALYFSDLIDGPKTGWNGIATKGAAVTIWGKNFGYTRGSSNYVTVGGRDLSADSDYAEWGVTTNNARGMERIPFWLQNTCADGAGVISVTVDGVTSNTLPFYVRTTGNIRFVDHTNGLNTNNGQTDTAAWKTLGKARTSISGGDIVYIRAGTYNEIDADNRAYPAASTWAGAIDFHDQSHAWIYGCQLYQWGRDKYDHFFYLGEDINATDVTDYDVGWNECHD